MVAVWVGVSVAVGEGVGVVVRVDVAVGVTVGLGVAVAAWVGDGVSAPQLETKVAIRTTAMAMINDRCSLISFGKMGRGLLPKPVPPRSEDLRRSQG